MTRKIVHCDCDCFYAAVEARDDPSLRGVPLAVGGAADRRGVIATCNYSAREFGVRSAMSTAHALRMCPDLVLVPPNFDKYREAANEVRRIFLDYTELVEPLSMDEAYLDVTDCGKLSGSGTLIAGEIRRRINEEVGITASAGVAPNKFLAKIASDWQKPNGLFVITPDQVEEFVRILPVGKLHGVGRATESKLHNLGVETCGDLREFDLLELVDRFGVFGKRLYDLCRGVDHREVKPDRRRKSLSVENTYSRDLPDLPSCLVKVDELCLQMQSRLRRVGSDYVVTRRFLKMRFDDFSTTTVERGLGTGTAAHEYRQLCEEAWHRGGRPVRLLGVGVKFVDLAEGSVYRQLNLFE